MLSSSYPAAFAKTNSHFHAGIAQVLGMGMALAAITDDGDLLALDQADISIGIIINAHGKDFPEVSLKIEWALNRLRPAGDGHNPGSGDLDKANLPHQGDELVHLLG